MRLLLSTLLILGLCGTAGSQIKVAHLQVNRNGQKVNIRVTVRNPDKRWRGPLRVELYARRVKFGPWLPLKTWTKVPALGPGHRVCRDFFDDNSVILRSLAVTGSFQVRAVITAPGLKCIEEKSSFTP